MLQDAVTLPSGIRSGNGLAADALARYLGSASRPLPFDLGGNGASQASRTGKELRLRIDKVHCVQRVGWEATDWDGKDVILGGGLGFDSTLSAPPAPGSPSTAHFRKVPQFTIGTFGNDGSIKNFNPDKVFCKWALDTPGPWPRVFFGIISVAERDSGDEFPDLLESIWKMLSPQVIQAISALAAAGVGLVTGAIIGSEVPIVGTIVGAVAGAITGFIIGLVIDSLRDDLLETSDTLLVFVLDSPTTAMPANGRTPVYAAGYNRTGGQSGIYDLRYYWEVDY